MSDWLERELARGLAPVAAPEALRVRLGLAPAKPWVFPRVALAVAAAVMLIIGAGYAASRTASLDLRQIEARELRITQSGELGGLARCDGGGAMPVRMSSGKATILLAHTSSETPAHSLAATNEAGCLLCHSL
jgi:hypothetical protein